MVTYATWASTLMATCKVHFCNDTLDNELPALFSGNIENNFGL